jgi:DNA repair exonuclease SbcCD ATPase subunit
MLGLAGTLYGLLIGLDISGVSDLAEKAPSADSIRTSLDRLLAGTATALLSSLVGLVGAFLAAKPLPWIFRSITGIEADESKRTLSETVERLTEDMRGLSKASRTFAAHLRPESLDGLFARLDRQESAIDELQKKVSDAVDQLTQIKAGQTETNAKLQKIESLEEAVKALLACNENTNKHIESLFNGQQQTNRLLEQLNRDSDKRHNEAQQSLTELTATAKAGQDSFKQNQNTIRKALALYAATE